MSGMNMDKLRDLSSQATQRLDNKGSSTPAPAADPKPAASPAPAASSAAPASADPKPPKKDVTPESSTTPPAAASADPSAPAADPVKTPTLHGNTAASAISDPPAAYEPNFKYRAGKENREVPELFRSLLKDPESEKAVKEILERADGLPYVKQAHQELYESHQGLSQKHENLNAGLREFGNMLRQKDFDTFFDSLKVNHQDVFEWALQKAEYAQLPPERKREIDEARAARRQARDTEREYSDVHQQLAEITSNNRRLELRLALNKPDISSFANSFDEKVGENGRFENEVIRMGKHIWDTEKKDVPPEEAAKRVMQHYGVFMAQPSPAVTGNPAPTGAASAGQPAVPTTPAAARSTPPVLPNLQGGTTSPTKSVPKNMADLKKLAAQAQARISARQNA